MPPVPRASRRVAVDAEVRLEFERFTGFLEEMAANLSEGGMFVRTRNLRPVGSRLRFEIGLSDQWPLVRGTGEVVWTRWRDGGEQEPAGMGIRFELLDSQSRDLVARVVAERRRAGRSPFDLEGAAPPAQPEPDNWFDLAKRRDTEDLVVLPAPAVERAAEDANRSTEEAAASALSAVAPAPIAPAVVATSFELGPLFPEEADADEPLATIFEPPPPIPAEPARHAASEADGEPGMSEFRNWLAPPASDRAEAGPLRLGLPIEGGPSYAEESGALPTPGTGWRTVTVAVLVAAALTAAAFWMSRRTSLPSTAAAAPAPIAAAPAAGAVAAPEAATTEPAPAPPFTALERITWEPVPSGTLVTLWMDGAITADAVRHSRLEAGGVRELLQIRGARRAFPTPRLEVDGAQLVRVRTGFHQRGGGDEQHVVLDLAGRTVRLLDLEVAGNQVRLRLGPAG